MDQKYANPAPLGLMGFGMTTVLLNIHNAGFFPVDSMVLAMGIFYGGIAQYRPFFAAHGWKPFFFGWDLAGHPDEVRFARLSNPRLSAPYEGPWRSLALDLVAAD